jgi:hypothetical protein
MALELRIGGTPRTVKPRTLSMRSYVNARRTLRAGVLSVDSTYRPAVDNTVELYDGASLVFKGKIRSTSEAALTLLSGIITNIEAADYSALAEQRLVKASTAGGINGRDAIDYLVTNYLSTYGVSRDAGMAAGATLGELSYDYARCADILNDIVRLAAPTGWVWYIDDSLVLRAFLPSAANWPCPFSINTSTPNSFGDITVTPSRERYANRVFLTYNDGSSTPQVATAEDAGEIAANGIWEKAFSVTNVIDATAAAGLAAAYLVASLIVPKTVKFTTRTSGARPGMTININMPARNINNDFLITEVETWDEDGINVVYRVTCVEGAKIPALWLDTYRSWSGTGSGVAAVGGGGVIAVVGRASYPLGGSDFAGVQGTSGVALQAAGAVPVQLDTTALGAASVTAVVTCKATGANGVTPEIWNISDNTLVGSGTIVTGATPTTRIFTITPTAGQKYYVLKLMPNATGSDVYGYGYLEVGR